MNKAKQFWIDAWQQGRTHFHQATVNADLEAYFPRLNLPEAAKVLVPLCGKSLDMLWLREQGYRVVGIELSEQAVQQFAAENELELIKKQHQESVVYSTQGLEIWVADIFELPINAIASVDGIYDRGALIALPEKLRNDYVKACLQWLKPGGKILLKTMEYSEPLFEGPPYSVSAQEVERLYQGYQLTCLRKERRELNVEDHLHGRGLHVAVDYVWLIE